MKICHTVLELQSTINQVKSENKSLGFVPTMGALHQGHLALIQQSASENEVTVCSIFVNPIQFNNPEDLEKYPRTPEKDGSLIEDYCQILFMPSVQEMYPNQVSETFDFGSLETVMEGAFRPGHFNGVAVVVSRLFEMVRPNRAYFGEKDYQQLQIIKAMTKQLDLPVEIVACSIIREVDGLAMSSRNARLTPQGRAIAPLIFDLLNQAKAKRGSYSVEDVKLFLQNQFLQNPAFKIEYVEIADEQTLQPVTRFDRNTKSRIFVAVWLDGVRLIDNIALD